MGVKVRGSGIESDSGRLFRVACRCELKHQSKDIMHARLVHSQLQDRTDLLFLYARRCMHGTVLRAGLVAGTITVRLQRPIMRPIMLQQV